MTTLQSFKRAARILRAHQRALATARAHYNAALAALLKRGTR